MLSQRWKQLDIRVPSSFGPDKVTRARNNYTGNSCLNNSKPRQSKLYCMAARRNYAHTRKKCSDENARLHKAPYLDKNTDGCRADRSGCYLYMAFTQRIFPRLFADWQGREYCGNGSSSPAGGQRKQHERGQQGITR